MKMSLSRHLTTIICAVFIATGAVSGEDVFKAVGDQVSFRLNKLPAVSSITSIIWKHRNTGGIVVKVIEWDEEEIIIPNPRFKDITTVDNKTGQITITNLKVEHSGVYTTDINSKEQGQTFTLTVMERVPKPVIEVEKIKDNPDVVYLACKYSEKIIWDNSAREKLIISDLQPKGESITVKKNEGNPDNTYTCTLQNAVSKETTEPIYKKDLFKDTESNNALWSLLLLPAVLIGALGTFCGMYKTKPKFRDNVNEKYKEKPCIGAMLKWLDGKKGNGDIEAKTEKADERKTLNDPAVPPENNGAELIGVKAKPESGPVYENEGGQEEKQ